MARKTQTAAPTEKWVRLQVNNAGAWKDVTRFDAAEDHVGEEIKEAAHMLGIHDPRDIRFRLVIDDNLGEVLMLWTKVEGWKEWRHATR